MSATLDDAHELLIGEYEQLERDYARLKAAKRRERERMAKENNELRQQLALALSEIEELQALLGRSWLRPA